MHTTAHPDDENNGLLVMLNRGQGYRTALATATRGNGGQNEIGPEIFEALGVLRTGELAALHRFDGAEQYFTRAVDFGYSFSIEETFEKWGRDEITRRLRAADPHDPPRRDHHAAADRQRRRPASHGVGGASRATPTSSPAIRRSSRSRSRKACGRGSRGSCITAPASASRASRRSPGRLTRINSGGLRRAARQDLRGDRQRSAQHAQVPGHGAAAVAADADVHRQLSAGRDDAAAQMQKDETSLFDGVDNSVLSLAKYAGAQRAEGSRPTGST